MISCSEQATGSIYFLEALAGVTGQANTTNQLRKLTAFSSFRTIIFGFLAIIFHAGILTNA